MSHSDDDSPYGRWDAERYLRFEEERTRPATDLVAHIELEKPATIADLGCGPGNSTQLLLARWPSAEVLGIDHSQEMLAAARARMPNLTWLQADIRTWSPEKPIDLICSNAALHWVPHHGELIPRLFRLVAPGGGLAFQIPSSTFPAIRTIIHELSRHPAWKDRLQSAREGLTMESATFYYDALTCQARKMDLWETEFHHVLDSPEAVIDWMESTSLRPYLAALANAEERQAFLTLLRDRAREAYPRRPDGKVLFSFRRTFVIAYR